MNNILKILQNKYITFKDIDSLVSFVNKNFEENHHIKKEHLLEDQNVLYRENEKICLLVPIAVKHYPFYVRMYCSLKNYDDHEQYTEYHFRRKKILNLLKEEK